MKEVLLLSATCLLLLCLHNVCAVDCSWGSWSSCSVECGNGTRTRQIISGQMCTGPSTEICIVTSCMATNLAASLAATVTISSVYSSDFVSGKAIDGNPKDVTGQTLVGTDCAASKHSLNPWLRVDLQKEYFVSRVRVITISDRGENVYVHVGNNLTNNGNDNHNCGKAPYDSSNNLNAIWRDVSCSPPVWGRYINLQRIVTNDILHVCEVAFNYELEIAILDNNMNIEGTSVTVDENQDYSNPIDCGVSPDVTNFNALLQWKHNTNNDVPSSSLQNAGVYQVYENGVQRLYIKSTSASDSGVYTCQYTTIDGSIVSKSFTLNVIVVMVPLE
ncbi:uncharacterized protein LOC134185379 [Corticium candelabrum]|uniref:uncharacterized protein LOC134185379 n=1 Tax=Corticium candelabrum TaxID=121492 RepID=UPI002E2664CB|nr:uncharacterized protein LOC134185379 [Corticium candelabrum]